MASRPHGRYSTEFKLRLVHAYLDGEGSVKSIATRHGIGHSLLLLWIDKHRRGESPRKCTCTRRCGTTR